MGPPTHDDKDDYDDHDDYVDRGKATSTKFYVVLPDYTGLIEEDERVAGRSQCMLSVTSGYLTV